MGLRRADIAREFDEIVAFAGVQEFIDTPVKYYSSGMRARLAFSIAVCVQPDLLLLDEALAVGDETFQQSCLDRLRSSQQIGDVGDAKTAPAPIASDESDEASTGNPQDEEVLVV